MRGIFFKTQFFFVQNILVSEENEEPIFVEAVRRGRCLLC